MISEICGGPPWAGPDLQLPTWLVNRLNVQVTVDWDAKSWAPTSDQPLLPGAGVDEVTVGWMCLNADGSSEVADWTGELLVLRAVLDGITQRPDLTPGCPVQVVINPWAVLMRPPWWCRQ